MNATQLKELMGDERYMGKIITLSDGRKLSFSEAGNVETGYPVLFHVGMMASSLGVVVFHQEAFRQNLHIFAVDYPGVGDSTIQPDRTLRHWPSDVLEFTNQVLGENTSFALLAHSMGGPHALAVMADERLSGRIARATLVSPWLPFDGSRFMKLARWMPSFLQDSIIPTMATSWTTSTLSIAGSMTTNNMDGNLNMIAVQRIVEYSGKQGQEGNREMVRIAIGESLVLPGRVSCPVHVFCGTKDHLVAEDSCRKLVARIGGGDDDDDMPAATYIPVKDADHNTIMGAEHLVAILLTLQDS